MHLVILLISFNVVLFLGNILYCSVLYEDLLAKQLVLKGDPPIRIENEMQCN